VDAGLNILQLALATDETVLCGIGPENVEGPLVSSTVSRACGRM